MKSKRDDKLKVKNKKSAKDVDLAAEIEKLKAENEALKSRGSGGRGAVELEFNVGQKGWVSVYFGGRFPLNGPADVWERILKVSNKKRLLEFIAEARADGKLVERGDRN